MGRTVHVKKMVAAKGGAACYTYSPMNSVGRFQGTLLHIYTHWPSYLLTYSGIVLALIIIGASAEEGWFSFIPLTLAVLLIVLYFFLASLWAAHKQFDRSGLRPHHVLFDLGQIRARDHFVYIDLGLRRRALGLSRRLTTGRVHVVDIYNPLWTTSPALARGRRRAPAAPDDPRLIWHTGQVNLFPLPDNSVPFVIVCQVASEFWQHGDRLALLQEARRILKPNGRLLLAERVRTNMNWLVMGPGAANLEPAVYWRTLLTKAGFQVRKELDLQGIVHCYRADKPVPLASRQLSLELDPID